MNEIKMPEEIINVLREFNSLNSKYNNFAQKTVITFEEAEEMNKLNEAITTCLTALKDLQRKYLSKND